MAKRSKKKNAVRIRKSKSVRIRNASLVTITKLPNGAVGVRVVRKKHHSR